MNSLERVCRLQTAERARAAGKPDWFQLTCLIHDLGKVLFLWGKPEDGMGCAADGPQWAVGGDTFVVGRELACTFCHWRLVVCTPPPPISCALVFAAAFLALSPHRLPHSRLCRVVSLPGFTAALLPLLRHCSVRSPTSLPPQLRV